VANFLKTQTIIDSIKIFDTNPDILRGFANTNITVTVTVGNGDIPALVDANAASRWVANNIEQFYPQTRIKLIAVGNEILFTGNKEWISHLVPCIKSLHQALVRAGINDVKVRYFCLSFFPHCQYMDDIYSSKMSIGNPLFFPFFLEIYFAGNFSVLGCSFMIYIHSHEFMKIISENSTYHFKAIYTFKYNTNQIRFNYHQESQNVHFHKIAPKNIYIM
jgi:hypothetical protein